MLLKKQKTIFKKEKKLTFINNDIIISVFLFQ